MKTIETLFYSSKIKIPSQVQIKIINSIILFEGPLGFIELNIQKVDSLGLGFFKLNSELNQLEIYVKKTSKNSKAFFGSILSLCQNTLYGVSQGYLIYLELVGVGFRAMIHSSLLPTAETLVNNKSSDATSPPYQLHGFVSSSLIEASQTELSESSQRQIIELKIGQSHDIFYTLPENIRVFSLKPNLFCLYGLEKQQMTQVAAKLRGLKSPEPYKGKGIRLRDEIVKIKVGKKK